MMCQQRSVNTDGFTLGSKAKELPRLSDPIGLEQNFGSNEFTLGVSLQDMKICSSC
jgi:hypothetical protein